MVYALSVQIKGLGRSRRMLNSIANQFANWDTSDLAVSIRDAARGALASSYKGYQSGKLWRGIHVSRLRTNRNTSLVTAKAINKGANYAFTQEYGAIIGPKKKNYLTFKTLDGKFHRASKVHIPGKLFMAQGLEYGISKLGKYGKTRARTILDSKGKFSGWGVKV